MMNMNIIDERLQVYHSNTIEDEQHALKEILQEVALYGLANSNFFDSAIFQGGSALRILHGLPRFSEDLDFLLKEPNRDFQWEPYIDAIVTTFNQYGIHPEITDKSRVDNAVKKMFLKDDSIGKIIDLSFVHHPGKKLSIKFEIDTNPPRGSNYELKFIEFPLDYSIVAQDLSSNFSGKCHALLCRGFIKGRDWYDFSWYVAKKISPNLEFLKHAINQQGPWAHQTMDISLTWLIDVLKTKIMTIKDWVQVTRDVMAFLNPEERQVLNLWSADFFIDKLKKLESYS